MRTKALGIVFLALMVTGVWATYGVFTKKFTDYDEVTVKASRIGLQLPENADVKIKGVIVGEVLDFRPTTEGADITLGLYQDRVTQIPADVTASILPKTLFGEKFVSLIVPPEASADAIAAGDVIERTQLSIEVETVLSDLYPLLRAVQPADLNMTLNAIATALEGRGDQLGESLETLDGYLTRFNPELPALIEDLRLTAEVSDTYADVLPEVATILRNTITTTTTLEGREEKLQALFNDVTKLATVAERFSRDNGDNLVRPRRPVRRPARGVRPLRPRVPLPARGHRGRRQAAGRGVPRLHAPHRAGDAAQPAARLHGRGHPGVRRQARPLLRSAAEPAVVAEQPGDPAARLRRRQRLTDRQGHQPGGSGMVRHVRGLRRRS